MEAVLTRGAVTTIAESKAWHTAPVVLQVVDFVRIPPQAFRNGMPSSRLEGYTLMLSDGVHTHEMDLNTPLRHLVKDGRVRKGSIVRLLWYCTIFVPVIFKMEVLQAEAALIGSPVPYKPGRKDVDVYATQRRVVDPAPVAKERALRLLGGCKDRQVYCV